MIRIVNGDLLNATAEYICHQVNCMGVMGSGVAKQIREKWPRAYTQYHDACEQYTQEHGKDWLLGKIQVVKVCDNTRVVNMFGQLNYGRGGSQYTDMNALRRCFKTLAKEVKPGETIAMPYRIGCGLAGGDWGSVIDMISEIFSEHHLTLYRK